MTPDQRRDHVLDLTDDLQAMLVVDADQLRDMYPDCTVNDPCGYVYGRSRPFKGAPFMPPVVILSHDPGKSVAAYLVALHELGHIATERLSRRMLEREAYAWRWALKQSRADMTTEQWRAVAQTLGTYRACRRCTPSTDFNRLLKQAERRAA